MKSKLIYRIIAPLVLIITGIVLCFTVGFNKGLDLTGYNLVEVNVGTNKIEDAYKNIKDVLDGKDLKIRDVTLEQDDYGDVIAVKFTSSLSDTTSLENQIKDELIAKFGYDQSSIIEQTYIKVSGHIEGLNIWPGIAEVGLAIVIALVAVFVYNLLRFNLPNAMSIVLSVILDILTMISIVLITRLPINSTFGIAIAGTAIFSILLNTIFYDKLVYNSKEEKYLTCSNEEVIKVTHVSFKNTLITLVMGAIFATAVFAYYNIVTTVCLSIGFLTTLYTSQMLVPYLWAFAYKRKFKQKKVNAETEEK